MSSTVPRNDCSECGLGNGCHYTTCSIMQKAIAALPPQPVPTAYERDRQQISDRLFKLECQNDVLLKRLDAALRRIEALELEVAKLKGPRNHRREVAEFDEDSDAYIKRQMHGANNPLVLGDEVVHAPLPDEGT